MELWLELASAEPALAIPEQRIHGWHGM